MLSHTNFNSSSINWIASLHFSEDTVYLHSAGFFHLAGASPAIALTMVGGTHVYKCPRSVEVRDALPVSGAGKLQKKYFAIPIGKVRSGR